MNHLESITEKLHALLPELRELSFGCRILVYNGPNKGPAIYRFLSHGRHNSCLLREGLATPHWVLLGGYAGNEFKILGHPITLEHVLKALGILNKHYALSYEGRFIHLQLRTTFVKLKAQESICGGLNALIEETDYKWDFGLPLHKQSPEVHEFLDSLLPEPPQNE